MSLSSDFEKREQKVKSIKDFDVLKKYTHTHTSEEENET